MTSSGALTVKSRTPNPPINHRPMADSPYDAIPGNVQRLGDITEIMLNY